jgi:hypothetical protein
MHMLSCEILPRYPALTARAAPDHPIIALDCSIIRTPISIVRSSPSIRSLDPLLPCQVSPTARRLRLYPARAGRVSPRECRVCLLRKAVEARSPDNPPVDTCHALNASTMPQGLSTTPRAPMRS